MANNENLIPIPGRLHSVATEGHVAGADEIYDDTQSKLQSAINADVAEDISDLQEIVGEGSVDTRIENAVKALDAEKSQTAGADGLALSVTEVDGKITSISGSIATDTYDSYGSASAAQEAAATDATTKVNAAKAELLGDAATDYNTLGKLEDAIQSEASTRETEIGTDSTAGSVKGRIKSLETLVGSTDVDSQIDAKINALDSTKSQTAGADGLALSIEEEDGKIKSISGSITANTYDAYGAASTAKSDLLGDAASDYNTLGKLEDAIQAEATTRSGETEALDGRLDNIEDVIPSAASSSNQLADKSFVNSSISTATAEFQGSYNSVSDLELTTSATHAQIATALGTEISGADNNDYCFVQIPTADATPTDIAKVERYKYNGTAWSFEYELNNSGYTDAQWAAINSGITSNLVTAFGNKYDKPSTGIPSTDMASNVQTSLGKADSAYQKPSGGIPDSDLTSAVQTSLGKADTAYQKPSGGIPASDLADGVIPDISGKANKSEMSVVDGTGADVDKTTITLKDGTSAIVLKSHQDISGKQDVIDSTHKLAADLVDDTSSTNKFTSATEKQTWNAKQDALAFNTTPSADNKVATMADIEDATENAAYLGEDDSSAVIADFDPQTDTVWKKGQTLSNAEKSQVKTNLGLPQEIYSKTEVNGLITTPNQQYVTVATYASLPATGSADTVYRVSNYNGSTNQVDATMYSEYAWNGSDYTFLCVKSQVGEVFDITAYNSNTKYADLAAALGTNGANIPESLRKGGMSVKFVLNSDNKYVQARCIPDEFTTDVEEWAICEEVTKIENPEFSEIEVDNSKRILRYTKKDGSHYAYKMHSETIDNKVEKIDGKGLIDDGFAATNTTIDNLEYSDLKLGKKNEVVEGITRKGRKEINIPIDLPTGSVDFENNEEWADVTTDSKGRVTKGTRKDGSNYLYELRSESLDRLEAKFHPIIVSKNYPADYSSLSKAIIEATKEFDRVVIVDEGTYDIIQEFKEIYNNSFFDNYTGTYPHGLFLKNRIKLYFSPKANVVCNYTGNNDSVKINFSPFNSGMYGFEIHGLNIHCENVRYCIHDERAQDTDLYYNVYDGCNMYLDNSNNTAWQSKQCIGGGLGANGNIKIQNCIFESVDLVGSIVSYHNCESSNAKSFLAINGNVCRGETTFRLSWYGSSTLITTAIISNNVIGTEIRHQAENASLYDTHNTELIEFNNVLQN